jgi:fumarate hydratase class II
MFERTVFMEYRIEHDALGEMKVPQDKYWAAQTQRSLQNFPIGDDKMPREIIRAFAVLKKAAALTNRDFGKLDDRRCDLICQVCDEILAGKLDDQFPLSVWQTGSGTQSNMNVNEVIANRGQRHRRRKAAAPQRHRDMSQSSNDTFPTAMHIAAVTALRSHVMPALENIIKTCRRLEDENSDVIKIGSTHLQDATPRPLLSGDLRLARACTKTP